MGRGHVAGEICSGVDLIDVRRKITELGVAHIWVSPEPYWERVGTTHMRATYHTCLHRHTHMHPHMHSHTETEGHVFIMNVTKMKNVFRNQ